MKKSIEIHLFIFLLFSSIIHSQESVNASGGEATGSGGSIAFSIGQVIYTTNTSDSGSVSQGVQQAYEIYSLGTEDYINDILLIAYPNPTPGQLTLLIQEYTYEEFSYHIFSLQGKLLIKGSITEAQTQINMSYLPSAAYLLSIISSNNRTIKQFKIIKH